MPDSFTSEEMKVEQSSVLSDSWVPSREKRQNKFEQAGRACSVSARNMRAKHSVLSC